MKKDTLLSIYKGLPKSIYVLALSTVINGIGIFVYPFLTLYLTTKLGFSAAKAGTFMTIATMLYIPGSFIGSKLADSIGRKPVMMAGQACMALCYLLCGFIEGSSAIPWVILVALLFDGITDPAREALKTDITVPENRQASFSLVYLSHNLGYAVGPLLGGILFTKAPDWLFWGNGIAQLLSLVPVMLLIPESKPSDVQMELSKHGNSTEKAEDGGLFHALMTRPLILIFAVAMTFYTFAYSQVLFGLPLQTNALFGTGKGAILYGKINALNGLVVVIGNPLIVSLTRKKNPLINVAVGGLFFAIGYCLLSIAKVPLALYSCCMFYTVGEIFWATNEHYYVANNTPMSHRARFNAILPIIEGTGHCFAPMIGGAVIDAFSISWLWFGSAVSVGIGVSIILLLFFKERRKQRS